MDADMELAMRLQREEELIANDSLLASYLHEEINKEGRTPSKTRVSGGGQGQISSVDQRNLQQPTFNEERTEAALILSDDEQADEMTDLTHEMSDIPHHHHHTAHHHHHHHLIHNHNDDDDDHMLTDMFGTGRYNSWPLMPERTYNRLPQSIINGLMGPRRFEMTWHPYRPNSAYRPRNSFRINGGNARGNNDYESLWELGDLIGDAIHKGLNNQELNQLPTSTFVTKKSGKTKCGSASTSWEASSDSEEDECRICISNFEQKEELRILPCLHKFHSTCVDQWLKQNAVCPVCRIAVKEQLR